MDYMAMVSSLSKRNMISIAPVALVGVEEVISMSDGSSTLRSKPRLAVRFELVLLGRNEAFHASKYPISDLRCCLRGSFIEKGGKGSIGHK